VQNSAQGQMNGTLFKKREVEVRWGSFFGHRKEVPHFKQHVDEMRPTELP
jgi:hypothetical protein